MNSESNQQYEYREAREFGRQLQQVEKASLQDRKAGREDWRDAIAPAGYDGGFTPGDYLAERTAWLLDGNYGYGAMLQARRVAGNAR